MIGLVINADLEEMIQNQQWDDLRQALSALDAADIVELMIDLPVQDMGVIFRVLPRDAGATVFSYLPLDQQEELIQSLSSEQSRLLLDQMPPDDRTRLLEEMPAQVTRRLLETLTPEELKATRAILGYPEETAGRYMTPEYASIRSTMTATQALEHLRQTGRGKETLNVVYVLDDQGQLVTDMPLGDLVMADPHQTIAQLPHRPLVAIPATTNRQEMTDAFKKYDRTALPVVDAQGQMLGIITADDVIDVIQEQATEEMQKIGGMEALDAPYMTTPLLELLKKRAGWLAILFLSEMLTATAMGFFEHELDQVVFLALFIPLIISSGGNSGSQASTLIIRALALKEVKLRDWYRVFARELTSGLALGSLLGAIGFARIVTWYHTGLATYGGHPYLMGLTVFLSLIGVVCFGTVVGSMLPFLLRRIGLDPAASSAPFVATLVDVSGLVIYFSVAYFIILPAVHPAVHP